MNKTDLLLQMMQHPEEYTADEWQDILADDECRELYTLMSKTQSAIDAARAEEDITEEMIEAEWQRFSSEKIEVKSEKYPFLKIAAMFVGILMLSGIAYAAVHIISHNAGVDERAQTQEVQNINSPKNDATAETLTADSIPQTRIFENTPLDEMVSEIAHYYNKVADIQSEEAHELRLYYKWEPKDSLESVVDDLNHFDRVSLAIEDDKLIVKP